MGKNKSTFKREGNQLVHTRILPAPPELVWEVWTDPEHLKNWWGPDGFSITNQSMEVKPGGEWKFVMHGMGQDFDNLIRYTSIDKPRSLSYEHFDPSSPDDPYAFTVYVTFEKEGKDTLLTLRSVFKSSEVLDELNSKYHVIEGGNQTLNRLEGYIDQASQLQSSQHQ